jgi:tetratricopeptide (TPR) repeat protein
VYTTRRPKGEPVMRFTAAILFLGLFVGAAFYYWSLFAIAHERRLIRRWVLGWVLKGLLVPVALWVVLSAGISVRAPTWLPQIAAAKASGAGWLGAYLRATASGLMIIGSYWAAVTFGWLVALIYKYGEEPGRVFGAGALWGVLLFPMSCVVFFLAGLPGIGFVALFWLVPIAHATLSQNPARRPAPLYSSAIAKIHRGNYAAAEADVIRELEKCEHDFDGWMMLADLYANRFGEFAEAERTLRELADQPSLTPSQLATVLQRLADWHLHRDDPAAARRVLEEICARLPDTRLARLAHLRIEQLPTICQRLRERREALPIHLPAPGTTLLATGAPDQTQINRVQAAAQANQCVERLNQNPNDVAVREELARLLAERLERVDQAIEQMELLLDMPGQPDKKKAEWLALIAAWQIRYRRDPDAGRTFLERIICEFPRTAPAFEAQQRLMLLKTEARLRKTRTGPAVS